MTGEKKQSKKFLISAQISSSIFGFRFDLLKQIQKQGYEIYVIVPDEKNEEKFKQNNFHRIIIPYDRHSTNPKEILNNLQKYVDVLAEIKPDMILAVTLKPIICTAYAAKKLKISELYSMVSGLGRVYNRGLTGVKNKAVKTICNNLYKIAFRQNKKVFFQNSDDKNELVQYGVLSESKCVVINGSGVNMDKYKKYPLPKENRFLMVARPTKSKGTMDYFEAAKIVKKKYDDSEFVYIGGSTEDGQDSVTKDEIAKYVDVGIIEYIERTDDVYGYLKKCRYFVLPSYYREGVPHSILEALSVGRPIITLNTPGCKETLNGENGLFAKEQNPQDLANQMIYLIEHPEAAQKMSEASFQLCKNKFDVKIVNEIMLKEMMIR